MISRIHGASALCLLVGSLAFCLQMGGCRSVTKDLQRKPGTTSAGETRKEDKGKTMATKTSLTQARIKRDGEKVVIEGVPVLAWGKSGECTFAGAVEAALAATRYPYSYNRIMGYSGLAFRVRWYRRQDKPGWCPSSPVGEFPDEIAAVAKATGWQFHYESKMGQDHADMTEFAPAIAESIDAGLPVVGYPDNLDVSVAYGYQGTGKKREFLWRGYHWGAKEHALAATKTGPWVMFLGEHKRPLSRRKALIEALTTPNWRREFLPSSNPKGVPARYLYGDDALSSWSDDIGRAGTFDEEQRKSLFFVNWWCFTALCDARSAASQFCKDHAGEFKGEGRAALLRAAAVFEVEAGRLGKVFGAKNAFLGPWSGKSIKDWTPAVRKREQKILAEIRTLEADAIAEIDKALAAEGRQP